MSSCSLHCVRSNNRSCAQYSSAPDEPRRKRRSCPFSSTLSLRVVYIDTRTPKTLDTFLRNQNRRGEARLLILKIGLALSLLRQLQEKALEAHKDVNTSNRLESGYVQVHRISPSKRKVHLATVIATVDNGYNYVRGRLFNKSVPAMYMYANPVDARFRVSIAKRPCLPHPFKQQAVIVSVFTNHAWSHLRSEPSAHFKRTLLTRYGPNATFG